MKASGIPLGSVWFWLVWRLGTISVLVVAPAIVLGDPRFRTWLRFVLVGVVYIWLIASNEELAYGYASEDGIRYRRYFHVHFLPWDAIASVRWSRSNCVDFELKQGFLLRKTISTQSFGNSGLLRTLSEPPEVVRWLQVARPPGTHGITLKGPGL